MRQSVRTVKIIGTGSYAPETVYTNEYLSTIIETSPEWIYNNLGIRRRHIAAPNQSTSDLAAIASINAVLDAGLDISEIDLIIVATSTPDRIAPSTAAILQDKIKAYNAVAFDIAAVCSGFLFAMSVASQFIAANVYDNVLVVGADTFSKITDWTKRDAVFFGDGAGAAVLSHAEPDEGGFLSFKLYTDGRGKWNFTIPAGGSENPSTHQTINDGLHYFKMNGAAVYETGTKVLSSVITEVLKDANLSIKDVDLMIPHQPAIRMLKTTAELIGLPFEKVMTNMEEYANTSGGTIPILLDEVNRAGRIKSGDLVLFAAVGSGWTYGASLCRWTK